MNKQVKTLMKEKYVLRKQLKTQKQEKSIHYISLEIKIKKKNEEIAKSIEANNTNKYKRETEKLIQQSTLDNNEMWKTRRKIMKKEKEMPYPVKDKHEIMC